MLGIATGAFVEERDDWPRAVARAVDERWPLIELTAISKDLYSTLWPFLGSGVPLEFERISVHAPVVPPSSPGELVPQLVESPLPYDVIFHPDLYREHAALRKLRAQAVFENMDVTKTFGRSPEDMADVFRRFPEAGFCLDVAHVWTNDPSMQLGFELLEAAGDRLRQVHLSGIEPDGTHRTTTAGDLERYEPLLERCRHVPWILEAELDEAARERLEL